MVDVLTTRMFETMNRFSPRENNQTDSLASIASLKRFSRDQKYRRTLSRDADLKARDSQLFDIKENNPEVIIPKRRPFTGLSCQNCTLNSRESLVNKTTERLALKNILDFTPQVQDGFLHRTFPHLFQVYKLKKFDYPQVAEIVLKDERLQLAVEKTTIEQFEDLDSDDTELYQQLLKKNQKRAEKLLYAMRSTLSDFLLRFTSWVLYKLLPCFMSSVVAQLGHIEMLKEASKSNLPLIFLPLHKSHLDYILCTFILLNNNIRSPLVAAGDNLKIPFFGYLLRGLGAFFIKRRIDPVKGRTDHVYKAVLHTYLNECLRAGHNVEFFLEGGRTRTGKPCMPKYGVLSVIVEAFMDGTIEDALLVPVSVNYEKLVDGNFIREQLGQPKEMETFGSAIKGIWHVLNSDYGMMRIDFNQPFSLKELVNTFHRTGHSPLNGSNIKVLKSNPSTSSLFGTDVVSDDNKGVVERISKHIIYDCSQSTSVMCTNALAFLLLHKFRNGATIAQLSVALDELRKCLLYSRKDIGFSGESFNVINYAADMLGPTLVKKEQHGSEIFIKPFATLPNVIELSYYSNTLVTHFALESIVAMAIYNLSEHTDKFNLQDLVDSVLELCDIFQYEFLLCKPCQDLDQAITNCIQELSDREQLCTKVETNTYLSRKSRNVARHFDDDDEEEPFFDVVYEISKDEESRGYVKFLSGITMSLIESYAMTAYVLQKLVGNALLEVDLLNSITEEMKIQLAAGTLHYEEAVSVDPMKNALKLFQKWGILECYTQDRIRLYCLKESSNNSESVQQLYQRIQKYRNV